MISHATVGDHPALDVRGPSFRDSEDGPEDALVDDFLGRVPSTQGRYELTKFQEPQLGAWFPDLVIVFWEPEIANYWPSARRQLCGRDFRILQCLRGLGQAGTHTLSRFANYDITSSLERLLEADLIFQASHTWRPRSVRDSFAVSRLVAVEAKIKNWKKGLTQARRNRWFASESYLLLDRLPTSTDVVQQVQSHDVGLLTCEGHLSEPVVTPVRRDLPRSYASWLFNDWAWWTSS